MENPQTDTLVEEIEECSHRMCFNCHEAWWKEVEAMFEEKHCCHCIGHYQSLATTVRTEAYAAGLAHGRELAEAAVPEIQVCYWKATDKECSRLSSHVCLACHMNAAREEMLERIVKAWEV